MESEVTLEELERLLASGDQDVTNLAHELIAYFDGVWHPLQGPQTMAYLSQADIIGYGGSAGGGKSDLAIGKALTQHISSIIFRRESTQLIGVIDRVYQIIGHKNGYNGSLKIWRHPVPDKHLEFGSCPNLGDEQRYQGRPHDLIVFDEATGFLESQVRFLLGWNRTTVPGQKCQALFTFNPPTDDTGRWVVGFFAPWLDDTYPNPALPGELRYVASIPQSNGSSRDIWVDRPDDFVLIDNTPVYDFRRSDYQDMDIVTPKSRTFIPSRISDNPYLMGTGYVAQLQALPEPLRSQMLYGDFNAGITDDPWQVIPTAWVNAAMDRWHRPAKLDVMSSMGVDIARGGQDETVIARRHGMWFDEPLAYPGAQTPDGPQVAGLCIAACRDKAPMHIDVIGVGSSPYDFLVQANQQAIGVNVAERSTAMDKSGRLRFFNLRSELWWKMREALDPANNTGICLPPNPKLRADLCAPKWQMKDSAHIKVESREDIVKRTGRSPDYGSAYILALMSTALRYDNKHNYDAPTDWRLF